MQFSSETENKIIRAATQVFMEKGKDGARMQEIADRAGINKALLHYYYRSKDQLYQRVFETEARQFFAELLDSIPEDEDLAGFLRNFIDNYLNHLANNLGLIRFIVWEIEQGGHSIGQIIRDILMSRGLEGLPLIKKIKTAVEEEQIRPVDPKQFTLSLLGMCLYPFFARPIIHQIFPDINVTDPDFLEKRKNEIFNLIWNGIQK